MAEVKNAFIKSKMNLDLDARLVPQGEYRQGFNIQVSKSEGDDVGALENVLGNALLPEGNFQALNSGAAGLQAIGYVVNPVNNTVYIFLTNNTGTAYNSGASNFIYAYDTLNQTAIKLVEGAFLNFSTQNPIYGINIVENLLFWTDNKNQPRKININKTLGYYTNEDHVSVAKFAPYEAIRLYQQSTTTGAVGEYETTMKDVVSPTLPKVNAADQNPPANPYLKTNYAGDPDYLEDKFVRFSYRFKFEDNEYSTLAPFTQECFIPKQDGYFYEENEKAAYRSTIVDFMENKVNEITLNIPLPFDVEGVAITGATLANSLKVAEIDIVYKESDSQAVQVVDTLIVNNAFQTTYTGSIINYIYQSLKPYKTLPEADLIRVYDKVPVKAFSQEVSGNRVIYGNFQDKHTPLFENLEGQLTPQLDYKLGAFDKSNFAVNASNATQDTTSLVEYPNSTLKQNRNYQVGIVVSDRYGRSSTVLLSQFADASVIAGAGTFAASTHYHPYRNDADTAVASWPGDALKILFNSPISTPSPIPAGSGIPGLYVGSGNNYNALGWYSYKVVVKQFEQEYYNVYLPGILDGPPDAITGDDAATEVGFITLINDNINKVPRDLSEVGPEQKQFRSSVELFGRVTPELTNNPTFNKQFYPSTQPNTVITIGEAYDIFGTSTAADLGNIYDVISNPLVARISQISSNPIGSLGNTTAYAFQLGVFETSPVESRLDIYYETSTSGLISDLNTAIEITTNVVTGAVGNTSLDFNENQSHATGNVDILPSTPPGQEPQGFAPKDVNSLGEAINQDLPANRLTASIVSITSSSEEKNKSTFFTVVPVPPTASPYDSQNQDTWYRYKIQSTKDFYYGLEAGTQKIYNITVNFTDPSGASKGSAGFPVPLANTSPIFKTYTIQGQSSSVSIDPVPSNLTLPLTAGTTGILATFTGVNGTADTSLNTNNLTYSITSPANQTIFNINAAGQLSTTEDLSGPYPITINLEDAGGPTDSTNLQLTVLFGNEALNPEFGKTSSYSIGGGGESGALYFVNNLTNAAGSLPLPGLSSTIGINDIRSPYTTSPNQNLQLSNDVKEVSDNNGFEYVNIAAPDCNGFTMGNRNQNAMALGASTLQQSNAGLRQGTAFIGVQIDFTQQTPSADGFNEGEYPFLMFPVYLQYKPFGASTWQDAYDIEGKIIKFGGSQINRAAFMSTAAGGLNAVEGTGIINKISLPQYFNSSGVNTYPSGFGSNILQADCLEANTQVRNPGSNDIQNTIARKTFVIGKSSYAGVNDKFGNYRLIVRYPWGERSSAASTESFKPIVVGYGSIECPTSGFGPTGTGRAGSMVTASAFFDDFYYPSIYNGTNIYAYNYRISTSPQNTSTAALSVAPSIEVWAREWHMKYVTKFYTNSDLTTVYNPGKGWYIYSPLEENEINALYGTDYSNVVGSGNPNRGLSRNNFRKWVAYFDNNGLKSLVNSNTPSIPAIQ